MVDDQRLIKKRRSQIRRGLRWPWKLRYGFGALVFLVLPKVLSGNTAASAFRITIRFLLQLFIAAAPFWGAPLFGASVDLRQKLEYSAYLALAMILSQGVDFVSMRRKKKNDLLNLARQVASREAYLHRELAAITTISAQIKDDKEQMALERLLALMSDRVRHHLRNFDDTAFQATLFLFDDESCETFCVKARARADRPRGHIVPIYETAAYFCAELDPSRSHSIHDIRKLSDFPPHLSDGSNGAGYRSIFVLPLAKKPDKPDSYLLRGVVTIDSRKRFQFYGRARQEVESLLEPYKQWLLAITEDHPHLRPIGKE